MLASEFGVLAQRNPREAKEWAIEVAKRIGADPKHLAVARKLRGTRRAPGDAIIAYLAKSGLQRGSGQTDKAAKLAILAAGKGTEGKYCRALFHLATRLGTKFADTLPQFEDNEAPDPGSRGERRLLLAKQGEAAVVARKAADAAEKKKAATEAAAAKKKAAEAEKKAAAEKTPKPGAKPDPVGA